MKSKVVIVMSAYNAAQTLKQTLNAIPKGSFNEVLVVDDNSKDETVQVAKELGLKVIKHYKNS